MQRSSGGYNNIGEAYEHTTTNGKNAKNHIILLNVGGEDSVSLVDKDTFAVRGDGACFINAALYQLHKNDPSQVGEFYKPYNPNSKLAKKIIHLFVKYFDTHQGDTSYGAPDVYSMQEFLEKELNCGIDVDMYAESENSVVLSDDVFQIKTQSNFGNKITVAFITKALGGHLEEQHVRLPQEYAKKYNKSLKGAEELHQVNDQQFIDNSDASLDYNIAIANAILASELDEEQKKQEAADERQGVKNSLQTAANEASTPIVDKYTLKVRGGGKCFINAALYQICKQQGGLTINKTQIHLSDFHKQYDANDLLSQFINNIYYAYFDKHKVSEQNLYETPDVHCMGEFLTEKLQRTIKVLEYDSKSTNDNVWTYGENFGKEILVATEVGSKHITLPEQLEKKYKMAQLQQLLRLKDNNSIPSQSQNIPQQRQMTDKDILNECIDSLNSTGGSRTLSAIRSYILSKYQRNAVFYKYCKDKDGKDFTILECDGNINKKRSIVFNRIDEDNKLYTQEEMEGMRQKLYTQEEMEGVRQKHISTDVESDIGVEGNAAVAPNHSNGAGPCTKQGLQQIVSQNKEQSQLKVMKLSKLLLQRGQGNQSNNLQDNLQVDNGAGSVFSQCWDYITNTVQNVSGCCNPRHDDNVYDFIADKQGNGAEYQSVRQDQLVGYRK